MGTNDQPSPNWTKRAVGGVVAFVVFLGTLFGLWNFTFVQASTCKSAHLGPVAKSFNMCSDQYSLVSQSDATKFFLEFFAELTSSDGPRRAMELVANPAKTDVQDDLAPKKGNIDLIDLLAAPVRGGVFNSFAVAYRTYYAADYYQNRDTNIVLGRRSGSIVILAENESERDSSAVPYSYPQIYIVARDNVRRFPRMSSKSTLTMSGPGVLGTISLNGHLNGYCDIQVSASAAYPAENADMDNGWWVRVSHGWIHARSTSLSRNGPTSDSPIEGMPVCSPTVFLR